MRYPVPMSLRDHVSRQGSPPEPKDAATIVLVRDGSDGIETYLMRRQATMDFAAGMYVFPGGKVQESDRLVEAWVGPSPEAFAKRFDTDPDTARGLVVAAVRETFEESGILLAGADEDTIVADTSPPDLQAARVALEKQEYGFAEFLAENDLVLRADLVGAWSHWITPDFEPRRYDTRFFVAALPEGQVVGELPGEADRAEWMPIPRIVEAVEAQQAMMLPPTLLTCKQVGRHSAATILQAADQRDIITIAPFLVEIDGELFLDNQVEEES